MEFTAPSRTIHVEALALPVRAVERDEPDETGRAAEAAPRLPARPRAAAAGTADAPPDGAGR